MADFAPDPTAPVISDEELEQVRIEANAGETQGIELRGDGKGAGSGQEVQ
jgi:EKC/KEOPS complex subunit PCC1/LAGE3